MTPIPSLLLIDDDEDLQQMLASYLSREGFRVQQALDGHTGLGLLSTLEPDLVILDFRMPGLDGLQTLGLLRQRSTVPVLMLTARDADVDRIRGLDMGADDYIGKPFNARELLSRIRAILRRTQTSNPNPFRHSLVAGSLQLFPSKELALLEQTPVELTHTEFKLLEILVRQAGFVVSKQELSLFALKKPLEAYDRSIDMHMARLRAKLGKTPDGHPRIVTARGHGYQLTMETYP